jgi:hypothetical protein
MPGDLRGAALEEARSSVGFRRARTADLLARARAFEAWLKPCVTANDYPGWLLARRALQLACEDVRLERVPPGRTPADTRSILRRAEAYRAFLLGEAA